MHDVVRAAALRRQEHEARLAVGRGPLAELGRRFFEAVAALRLSFDGAAAAAARGEAATARRLVAGDGGGGDHNESLGELLMHLCAARHCALERVPKMGLWLLSPPRRNGGAEADRWTKINRELHKLRASRVWQACAKMSLASVLHAAS